MTTYSTAQTAFLLQNRDYAGALLRVRVHNFPIAISTYDSLGFKLYFEATKQSQHWTGGCRREGISIAWVGRYAPINLTQRNWSVLTVTRGLAIHGETTAGG
jgi:hypothetical protein